MEKSKAIDIIDKMLTMKSRQEGETYLVSNCLSKEDYVEVAKQLDVPHRANITLLKERIIEGTIGFRLRSDAIQGK